MRNIIRVLVGLVGLFNLALGLGFFVDTARMGEKFFLTSLGTQGLATMRADMTAFFIAAATFALVGAWRATRAPLLVPLLLFSIAIVGRAVSLVVDGAPETAFPPMVVEAVMIAVLALGYRSFGADPRR